MVLLLGTMNGTIPHVATLCTNNNMSILDDGVRCTLGIGREGIQDPHQGDQPDDP